MGSGKGSIDSWVAVVKEGTVMFEIKGLDKKKSYEILTRAGHKFPIKCKVIEKEEEKIN
jgi:large subunit ribosomal protein L16